MDVVQRERHGATQPKILNYDSEFTILSSLINPYSSEARRLRKQDEEELRRFGRNVLRKIITGERTPMSPVTDDGPGESENLEVSALINNVSIVKFIMMFCKI